MPQFNGTPIWYHLDLDLPQTGISSLESEVPLPRFVRQDITATPHRDERSLIEYPFLAMIAIRRLTSNIHAVIFDSASSAAEKLEENCGPPLHIIAELARQLDNWRSLLPQPLQWTDDEKLAFSGIEHGGFQSEGAYYHQSPDSGFGDTQYRLNLDINTAQLRTRFYYARFMIYRPFVFKALHSPTLVTTDDVDRIVICMESALHWPIIMAPPKTKKRLVPYLFAWTQNLVGILLILRMTKENNLLKRICDEKIPRDKLDETASMMLEWIRDVKQLDGAAEWSWGFLEPLYANFSLTSHLN
ncbi:MAG: hypothetical protein M1820_001766 [Bogoriella megaspora]|nr:MAG: hypothetical protein M1820_001766 [Bogoriella megaspora]